MLKSHSLINVELKNGLKAILSFILKYRLLIFFILTIDFSELVYRLWIFKNMSVDFIFPLLFSLSAGMVFFLMCSIFNEKINKILAYSFTIILFLIYGVQLIYFCIFKTPFSAYSLTGAGDVIQFGDIILSAILKNSAALILLLIPLLFLVVFGRRMAFSKMKPASSGIILVSCAVSFALSVLCVNLTDKNTLSQYTLYYKTFSPELSVNRLGLLTTVRLDIKRLIQDFIMDDMAMEASFREEDENEEKASERTEKVILPETVPKLTSMLNQKTRWLPIQNIMNQKQVCRKMKSARLTYTTLWI